jgi:hypothetical protein
MIHADPTNDIYQNEYFQYDPISVSDAVEVAGKLVNRTPVSQIHGTPGVGVPGTSFHEMARKRGIIFMYKLVKDETKGEVIY